VEMLERDRTRFEDAAIRMNECPLGSGAIAGSTLPLDRDLTAKLLGFTRPTQNSMDAVSDRDFVIEYAFAASLTAIHLSRFAEDLILWSSAEFGFIQISDAFTTGSSLMPQKKNPDTAELIRGKSSRLIGNLVSLLTLLKGLPMTYNRDLQEDKQRLFDSADTLTSCLEVLAAMIPDIRVNTVRCRQAASDPHLLATDVADALVRSGIPFRKAHEIVGHAVALAEKRNISFNKLSLKDWKTLEPNITPTILKSFHLDLAIASRDIIGAPSPKQIKTQIARWKRTLQNN
jgi:argininosuccinate lyase